MFVEGEIEGYEALDEAELQQSLQITGAIHSDFDGYVSNSTSNSEEPLIAILPSVLDEITSNSVEQDQPTCQLYHFNDISQFDELLFGRDEVDENALLFQRIGRHLRHYIYHLENNIRLSDCNF